MKVVWGKKSQMQQAMSRDSKGEPFIIRELEFKGAHGMLLSAIHNVNGEEKLNLVMLDDAIPAGAKLY